MRFETIRDFPWRWALWWIFFPNLAFIAMWPIGGPRMAAPMLLGGLIAIVISHWTHRPTRIVVAAGIFVLNLLGYLALSFNLSMSTMMASVQFLPDLNPLKSPEYLAAAVILIGCLGAVIRFAPHVPALKTKDHKLLALGLVGLLINIDTVATAGTRGSYKMSAPEGMPVDSAMIQTGLQPARVTGRNLVVILVESWGNPSNPEDRALFDQVWNTRRWSGRYDVSSGVTTYFGSTTNAELREWCGVWADHESYDFDRSNCLPERFRAAGFQTVALHSFEGAFFDRQTWYPKIGFEKMMFSHDLKTRGASACAGVFPGACDRDVPSIIGDVLRERPEQRKLVYWLTVNGHLPLPADPSLATASCTLGTPEWREDFPMLCRTYEVQRQIADSITAEIMKADFPDADILIVGDHMPPFFPRYLRSRFDNRHVPWMLLRSRKSASNGSEVVKTALAARSK